MKVFRFIYILHAAVALSAFFAISAAYAASETTDNAGETSQWETGYWVWPMSESPYANPVGMKPPDYLYIAIGTYRDSGRGHPKEDLYLSWPSKVPSAARYLAVVRIEGMTMPDQAVIPALIEGYLSAQKKAAVSGQQIIGLQIDFDCPTGKLEAYADFLKKLRTDLPNGNRLSITALLDWFSAGSRIADVLRWADEYVPQFYDLALRGERSRDSGIAMPIDPARWAPVFNSYRRPYLIGISSFGRIAEIEPAPKAEGRTKSSQETVKEEYYRYSSLIDIMRYAQYKKISEKKSGSGERVLLFKRTDIPKFNKLLKVTIPTKESLLTAHTAARSMGGFCKGILFYRWPSKTESMALTPDEIERFISNEKRINRPFIEARDGYCALVSCVDLYVKLYERFPEKPVRLKIRSSADLEYFIPADLIKGKQSGSRRIEAQIPAYIGNPGTYIGRAVTGLPSEFSVEAAP